MGAIFSYYSQMKAFFLFVLTLFSSLAFAQRISGVVKEKGSNMPLPFANVFINNTTIGSATDENGVFVITGQIPETFELVASFVGYETVSVSITRNGKTNLNQNFELQAFEDKLSEVELKARRDKSWDRNMKQFREVFLALPDDPYLKDIEIHNPWVVDFEKVNPEKGANYVKASAQVPLKITNKALGYEIDFHLQDFRMLRNASRFFGQVYYSELISEDREQNTRWAESKENNYQGSVRHFLKSLLLGKSEEQGFEFYQAFPDELGRQRTNDFTIELGESIKKINPDSVLKRPLANGNYRIFLPERVEVHYRNKPWPNDYYTNVYHPISWLIAPGGYFDIDRNGVLIHPTQLVLSGHMGRQRVARALPLDFEPNETFKGLEEEISQLRNRHILLNNLREKPWLRTNKAFYYPGETAWVGGRMLYQNENSADSLSRVVYVELLDPNLKPVISETFPIASGKISGGFRIPESLPTGDYLLRAFTHWSLNFLEKDVFETPILIVDLGLQPKDQYVNEEELEGEIQLQSDFSITDSLDYRVLELNLRFLDSFDNPIDAEFLLSMTDVNLVPEILYKNSLFEASDWKDEALPETFHGELTQAIEYGISVSGVFSRDKNRRPFINPITIVRDDLADYGLVNTDSLGRFWATGLNFTDSARIAIAALDEKQKPFGSVSLIPLRKPVFKGSFPKLNYELIPIAQKDTELDQSGDYILLEEFVREEQKQKTAEEENYGFGKPDREIKEEELATISPDAMFGMLGIKGLSGKIGNFTFGETTGMPLLIIDGQNYPYLSREDFEFLMTSFVPAELESIAVYTLNSAIFGMAGYAGVIKIETKNGMKFGPESDRKFNSTGFQVFSVKGFSSFTAFPQDPPAGTYLKARPTLYWEPFGKSTSGKSSYRIKIPYGVTTAYLRVEGLSQDGEYFSRVVKMNW